MDWCNFSDQRNIWRCQQQEIRVKIYCLSRQKGQGGLNTSYSLVPWKIVGEQGTAADLACPVCFCRDFNPARPPILLHDWREKRQRVQYCLQWENLIWPPLTKKLQPTRQLWVNLCAVLPWIYAVGNWLPNCITCFFWSSIKSLCLELPTNTGGLCWPCHFVPSLLCMDYAQGWFQCFVKSVLQTPEMVHFYKNVCR